MPRLHYWILSGSCLLTGILALLDIPATLWLQSDSRELRGMNLLIQQGEECHSLWQKVAMRAYQLGQQDPGLLLVLKHQQINITPHPAAGAVEPLGAPATGGPAPHP